MVRKKFAMPGRIGLRRKIKLNLMRFAVCLFCSLAFYSTALLFSDGHKMVKVKRGMPVNLGTSLIIILEKFLRQFKRNYEYMKDISFNTR